MFGRRKNRNDSGEAIAEFWRWWANARNRVVAGIEDGTVAALAGDISARVAAIHKNLEWELTKGVRSQHALVVAAGGDASLRATVARWRAAAPAQDEVFEYFAGRQPDDDVFTSRIQIAGHELELDQLRFVIEGDDSAPENSAPENSAQEDGAHENSAHENGAPENSAQEDGAHELDVAVFHPKFGELPESARTQLTFLALDWALGEDQVELWIGAVSSLVTERPGLRTHSELQAAVADLAAKHAEPVYAMLGAENRKGNPVMAMVQVPLKSVRWPRFDTHIAVTARYPAQPNGLPTDDSLTRLRDLEDQIESVLPPDGEVVAHETAEGVRTIHVYADGTADKADAVTAVVTAFRALKAAVSVSYDPAFKHVEHLRP